MTHPKRFLPEQFYNVLGRNIPGILNAINESVEKTEQQIQAVIDQLFLVTASGRYLINLGESEGFVMPSNSGLDIRSYRVLVPLMVSDPKQVRLTIDRIIQAFYGSSRTKPNFTCSVPGAYSLLEGDNLSVETEAGIVDISITSTQVSSLTNVSAGEIVAILNASQELYLAEVSKNRSTGAESIKLTSNTPGSGAFIRIAGGTLQNIMKFPNVADTLATTGTTWNLTKTSAFTDELRFTWDGIGINPNVYLAKKDDIVTVRGFIDGIEPYSKLNGSFQLVDVGYDYFIVRNSLYSSLSSSVVQNLDTNVVFTKNVKTTLLDQEEYAVTSETTGNTITVTVPAVPPLARRFLAGSAHIHGNVHPVADFSRTNLMIEVGSDQESPAADNTFILTNKYMRPDFIKHSYKTNLITGSLPFPVYAVSGGDADHSVLPYTVTQAIGSNNPLYGSVKSEEFTLTFPFRHGLGHNWGFTLSGLTGAANILAPTINDEQIVSRVIDEHTVALRLYDTNGDPLKFSGISFGASSVYRHALTQASGADFYMDFGSAPAAIATGLAAGQSFKFDAFGGTDFDPFLAGKLRYSVLTVVSVVGQYVHFNAGLGSGPQGLVMSGVAGKRSGAFGGAAGNYFFDKTSAYNQEHVMNDLFVTFTSYSQSSNPLYLGAYLYDPTGESSPFTVSKYLVNLTEKIFKGESQRIVHVGDYTGIDAFPQSGELLMGFGSDKAEGPIRYSAFIQSTGNSQLVIDPAYKFKSTHDVGGNIILLHNKQPYVPTTDGSDYPFYITGTTTARETMFLLIKLLVAAGIFVEKDVLLPSLRYDDVAIPAFE